MDAIPSWLDPEAWSGFLAMRVKIKKPMTDRAKRMLIKRLTEMHSKGHDVNACLEQSEFHCYQDVYELKDKSIQRAEQKPETSEEYVARMAREREQSKGTQPTPEQRAKLDLVRSGGLLKRLV